MTRLPLILALVALMALTGVVARAQDDDCPADHACVTYKNDTIAIDPEMGFFQAIVVEERDVTVRDFDGERTTRKVTFAGFAANGDTFAVQGEHTVARDGLFVEADLGDVFVLVEAQ